jgi:hypothetical protein
MRYALLALTVLSACSPVIIQYPSVCVDDDKECQRNLNAQTLSYIGQHKAATQLLCMDLELNTLLGDDCAL